LTTPDDVEKVARFYAEVAGFEEPAAAAESQRSTSSFGTLQGESHHILDDFVSAADTNKLRPVASKCLIRRGRSYDLTVLVTSADGEQHTHIVLLYDPRVESEGGEPTR
jgi:hypothetical protein